MNCSTPLKRTAFKVSQGGIGRKTPLAQPERQRKALNPIGRKGNEWLVARAWLKRHFRYAGIVTCEARLAGCWFDNALSFAHCRKRRKLQEGEIYHVALLCTPCHDFYERMAHDAMHDSIHHLISRRGLIAPK